MIPLPNLPSLARLGPAEYETFQTLSRMGMTAKDVLALIAANSGSTAGLVKADGTTALTGPWNAGNQPINSQNSTLIFNVIAYGADPTGAVDSTAAINAAIAAASAAIAAIHFPGFAGGAGYPLYPVGAKVYFPRGTYQVAGTILVSSNAITLEGEGRMMSRLYVTSAAGTVGTPAVLFQGAPVASTGQLRKNSIRHIRRTTSNG